MTTPTTIAVVDAALRSARARDEAHRLRKTLSGLPFCYYADRAGDDRRACHKMPIPVALYCATCHDWQATAERIARLELEADAADRIVMAWVDATEGGDGASSEDGDGDGLGST